MAVFRHESAISLNFGCSRNAGFFFKSLMSFIRTAAHARRPTDTARRPLISNISCEISDYEGCFSITRATR